METILSLATKEGWRIRLLISLQFLHCYMKVIRTLRKKLPSGSNSFNEFGPFCNVWPLRLDDVLSSKLCSTENFNGSSHDVLAYLS